MTAPHTDTLPYDPQRVIDQLARFDAEAAEERTIAAAFMSAMEEHERWAHVAEANARGLRQRLQNDGIEVPEPPT